MSKLLQQAVQEVLDEQVKMGHIEYGELRDEYHSIRELYAFRKAYNAALFNEWANESATSKEQREALTDQGFQVPPFSPKYDVHKSWKHYDGEDCFGGGWFVVVAMLPDGQITNHYKAESWDEFQIPETPKAKYEFDGHTGMDVLQRLNNLNKKK